ncbi:hypothetical protein [Streptomyces goshikiensis]|uniref:hypothetical protein n=1 Tax=Streptomyces goshikiensis TaxID=1942 RepID=UPI00368B2A1D
MEMGTEKAVKIWRTGRAQSSPEQVRQVAEYLAPFGPGHPWTGVKFAAAWGARVDSILVRLGLLAEVSADRAIDRGGVIRHPLRFERLRLDVTAEDVPGFGPVRRLPQDERYGSRPA